MRTVAIAALIACAFEAGAAIGGAGARSRVPQENRIARSAGYFVGSSRSDPSVELLSALYRTFAAETASDGSLELRFLRCTAFRVASPSNQILLMSARHCFGYDPEALCRDGRLWAQSAAGGPAFACDRIAALDRGHDAFVFALRSPEGGARTEVRSGAFRLSACEPPVGAALFTLGFPFDRERSGRATLTAACVRLPDEATSFHARGPRNAHEKELQEKLEAWRASRPLDQREADAEIDRGTLWNAMKHNCTTWPGNSGGPAVAGGDVAVGLPLDAALTERPLDDSTALLLENLPDFVARNRSALEASGVELARDFCSTR